MNLTAIDDDPEFFHGLTVWTSSLSMQIRDMSVALHVKEDAMRSSEAGNPVILDRTEARRVRDLLNVATARGAL